MLKRWFVRRWQRRTRLGRGRPRGFVSWHDAHWHQAAQWLLKARQARASIGLSPGYQAKRDRWRVVSAESTGAAVPAMYGWAQYSGQGQFAAQATSMARWLVDFQLDSGAVAAGTLAVDRLKPAVFSTGQALLAWCAAYERTGEERLAAAMNRAADWLVSAQSADGAWRHHGLPGSRHPIHSFNCRAALGLVRASHILDQPVWRDHAQANLAWVATQANELGWLDHCDTRDIRHPRTARLALALQSLLEAGQQLSRTDHVRTARLGLAALARQQQTSGALPARFDEEWRPMGASCCVTGTLHAAHAWFVLARLEHHAGWLEHANRAVAFARSTQIMERKNTQLHGALPAYQAGRQPFRGNDCYPTEAACSFIALAGWSQRLNQADLRRAGRP